MIIEIDDVNVLEDIYSKDDKHIVFRKQKAYAHLDGLKYPVPIVLNLFDNKPYEVGKYTISGKSFRTDKYKNLKLKSFLVLEKFEG